MRAATRVVLQSAASLATPTLAVSAGAKLVPLAAATCVATPTLAVKAPTQGVARLCHLPRHAHTGSDRSGQVVLGAAACVPLRS